MPRKRLYSSILAALSLAVTAGTAPPALAKQSAQVPYMACFEEAAQHQNLPVKLLVSIAEAESSFRPAVVSAPNKNRTRDIGIMQINSWWIPTLAKHGIKEEDLKNPCINIHVGAWILAQGIARHGWNWKGIGSYNAHKNVAAQIAYTKRIIPIWKKHNTTLASIN